MTTRNLFAALAEGFDALAKARDGQRTLRTHELEVKPAPEFSAAELLVLRERLHLSRGRCSPATCAPIHAHSKTGNRDEPSPTPRRPC